MLVSTYEKKEHSPWYIAFVLFATFKVFCTPVQSTLGQLFTYARTRRGRSKPRKLMKKSGFQLVSPACGRAGKSFHPHGVQRFNIPSPKKASLANFAARMVILHSVLNSLYFCKTLGILFNCVLSHPEEASSWNFGLLWSQVKLSYIKNCSSGHIWFGRFLLLLWLHICVNGG